jgi:hypothetical protein
MKTIYLSILLALAVSLPLQAQYSIASYELATSSNDYYYKPFAEQQDIFNLYAPSEITLKNNLQLSDSGSDEWLSLPNAPDGEENALKIPINNGLWVLIMCLLGYTIVRRMQSYKF